MGMSKVASRLTSKTFTATGSAGALTVASGLPVTVYGIAFQAVTANVFTVANGAGTALFTFSVAANSSNSLEVTWKADAGITIQSGQTDGSAVVFHESPGN